MVLACQTMLVAASSVMESWRPPIAFSAESRTALFVPTNMAVPNRLPARWMTLWKRYCWLSAALVMMLS